MKLALFSSFLLLGGIAYGQDAELSGTVRDVSGAVIPGAEVHLVNKATGLTRSAVVNGAGVYTFPSLLPGVYDIDASAAGFKKFLRTDLKIDVAQRAQADFALEVGSVQDSVTVSAAGEVLNTTSGSVGNIVDQKRISELPLNGRDYLQLALLQPNVFAPAQGALSSTSSFNVAGQSDISNSFTLDGINNNDEVVNYAILQPVLDSIQEFRVLTGTYSAEYGRQFGGQVIVWTKSGTNEFHGTAWDFYRNSVFDARNFFATSTPSFIRSQYGAVIGGPIRKNKTFFFGSWENQNRSQSANSLALVPPLAFRDGNFSSLSTVLKNPFANDAPFAGNVIPPSMINLTGLALLDLYPAPNVNSTQNNISSSGANILNSDQFSMRVDHRIGDADQIYAVYEFSDSTSLSPLTRTVLGWGTKSPTRAQSASTGWTHIFGPTLVNEARVGYSRNSTAVFQDDSGINVDGALGINANPDVTTVPRDGGTPQIALTGYATIGDGTNTPQFRHDNNYNYLESMTLTKGSHTMKWGFDVRRFLFNSLIELYGRGAYTFQGGYTGNPIADLLLGLPYQAQRTTGSPYAHPRSLTSGYYFQDDWKATPRLTVNLGLRWDINAPPIERLNKMATFDPANGTVLDAQGLVLSIDPSTGLLVSNPYPGYGPAVYNTDWHNLGPRVGLAYRPFGEKTVIRAGFGTYYDMQILGNGLTNLFRSSPFRTSQTVTFQYPTIPSLANAFSGNPAPSAAGINPNFENAYINQWTAGVQRELAKNLLLDVTYQGSEGHDLPIPWQINQAIPGPGAEQSRRPYPLWGPLQGGYVSSIGNSNFNSLQARLERRFSSGLSFSAVYVWSKSIDDAPGISTSSYNSSTAAQNFQDLEAERGPSDFNVPQHFVGSYVYNLPFKVESNRAVNAIVSGWQLTGILTLQSGNPFTIYDGTDVSSTGGGADRPNVIGNWHVANPSPSAWFNTCTILASGALSNCLPGEQPAWQIQPAGTFGNAGRNILYGPSLKDFDLGLYRQFKATERVAIQFRVEFYNALNHPNFAQPNLTVQSSSFGTITAAANTGAPGSQRQGQFALKVIF
jgi:Carboxypeptidase regulatory-like domain